MVLEGTFDECRTERENIIAPKQELSNLASLPDLKRNATYFPRWGGHQYCHLGNVINLVWRLILECWIIPGVGVYLIAIGAELATVRRFQGVSLLG